MELGVGTGLCCLMIVSMSPDCTIKLTNLPELQDLMCSNIERNFGTSSLFGGSSCAALRWGVESDYTGAPYNIVIGADVVALPYDLVALAQTFHALIWPWTRVYVSGKARLAGPHVVFEGEMVRPFGRVRRVNRQRSRLRSPGIFIIVPGGKR